MARSAQRLQRSVPEPHPVASVRFHMVSDLRRHDQPFALQAPAAQRVRFELPTRSLAPSLASVPSQLMRSIAMRSAHRRSSPQGTGGGGGRRASRQRASIASPAPTVSRDSTEESQSTIAAEMQANSARCVAKSGATTPFLFVASTVYITDWDSVQATRHI